MLRICWICSLAVVIQCTLLSLSLSLSLFLSSSEKKDSQWSYKTMVYNHVQMWLEARHDARRAWWWWLPSRNDQEPPVDHFHKKLWQIRKWMTISESVLRWYKQAAELWSASVVKLLKATTLSRCHQCVARWLSWLKSLHSAEEILANISQVCILNSVKPNGKGKKQPTPWFQFEAECNKNITKGIF